MAGMASTLYVGTVQHRRFKPKSHRLRYRAFWMLIDLDELAALPRSLRLFSVNRLNVFSIHERDYGEKGDRSLRAYVEHVMSEAGLRPDGGPIRLLTMPRILGYAFNPLSVYFCYRSDGSLCALCYEVTNTFGQRHSYLIPVERSEGTVRQRADKRFYVSPFLDMALSYAFRVTPPGETVAVSIRCDDAAGHILDASLVGRATELCDRSLAATLVTHPLLTLKVIAGIHWEALRLWLKGVPLHRRPPAPRHPVTVVTNNSVEV